MEPIRILLVDDEEDFRQTVAKRLAKRGMHVRQASNGENCLSMLEKEPVDIVVLDVKMPGMDGIEALRHIKERHPRTQVIMLTGHACAQDGVEGIKRGAFDYLSKPIELEHLLTKINQAYDKIIREEEKEREAAFRASMEQQMIATERLASLGTLAAGVAHEINNPLAIIKESAGWILSILHKDELKDMPRRSDLELGLSKIQKGVERIRRITLQLLESVKQTDSLVSEVNPEELARETVDLVCKDASAKDVRIMIDSRPDVKRIWTDPYKLRQVLINLLTNAVYAAGPGGTVAVMIRPTNEGALITVQDTGQGIPRENLARIFEPFFSTKPPGEGTGLGLFVTRGIIEKLGGAINVKSEFGKGSAFEIRLPLHPEMEDMPDASDNPGAWLVNVEG
ncbi:MAG: response regulator [Deltaproteobacteria bacterium]|nr:response regulator [Deltaproteobacteria bacterium]